MVYIGVDVHDNAFHATAFFSKSEEIVEIKFKPTFQGLKNKIGDLASRYPDAEFEICYEASYIGFTLQREFVAAGFECKVVAPNSIPRVHGNQVKTDRLDAVKLAQFLQLEFWVCFCARKGDGE